LYKQKIFSALLPLLLSGFHQSAPESKAHYLSAMSHFLKHVPQSVLLSELPSVRFILVYHLHIKIMPLLVQSMSSQELSLLNSTLHTFSMLLSEAPNSVEVHLSTLVPLFLSASSNSRQSVRSLDLALELMDFRRFVLQLCNVCSKLLSCLSTKYSRSKPKL
jgi:DNA repair/transcription protein MET18/MMS19